MPDFLNNPISFKEIEYQFATSGVYAIYCMHSDTYYIGEATVVLRRLVDHFTQLSEGRHKNSHMQREFDMFGKDQFIVDLIVDMPDQSIVALKVQETKEIQRFKSHGKALYNKTSTSIKLNQPEGGKGGGSGKGDGSRENQTHAEKLAEINPEAATCYDCGMIGLLTKDVFSCDDKRVRCQPCIESYLDNWRRVKVSKKEIRASLGRANGPVYRRWGIPTGGNLNENILLAAKSFAERFGYMPTKVFIHPDMNPPRHYRNIEIVCGGIVPVGRIDILINPGNEKI